ncbi:MAG: hypothetical protein JWL63_2461 [Rhodocyclales bacterium]|nr:hypothetical protein [Rhodocyclales bacterium]
MRNRLTIFTLFATLAGLSGCGSLPGTGSTETNGAPRGSHKFQCHAVSPGPCTYVVFNESGSVRETFTLAPGASKTVADVQPRTAFCLAVEKPIDPTKCQRLALDGRPLQK